MYIINNQFLWLWIFDRHFSRTSVRNPVRVCCRAASCNVCISRKRTPYSAPHWSPICYANRPNHSVPHQNCCCAHCPPTPNTVSIHFSTIAWTCIRLWCTFRCAVTIVPGSAISWHDCWTILAIYKKRYDSDISPGYHRPSYKIHLVFFFRLPGRESRHIPGRVAIDRRHRSSAIF